jgi:hypothetical protein
MQTKIKRKNIRLDYITFITSNMTIITTQEKPYTWKLMALIRTA